MKYLNKIERKSNQNRPSLSRRVKRVNYEYFSQASAWVYSEPYSGEDSIRAPPLPIPNREVKPYHADGTAKAEE